MTSWIRLIFNDHVLITHYFVGLLELYTMFSVILHICIWLLIRENISQKGDGTSVCLLDASIGYGLLYYFVFFVCIYNVIILNMIWNLSFAGRLVNQKLVYFCIQFRIIENYNILYHIKNDTKRAKKGDMWKQIVLNVSLFFSILQSWKLQSIMPCIAFLISLHCRIHLRVCATNRDSYIVQYMHSQIHIFYYDCRKLKRFPLL